MPRTMPREWPRQRFKRWDGRIEFHGPLPHLDRFAARVDVAARGQLFHAEQGRSVIGRAENFMSKAQVQEKAFELMSTVLDPDTTRQAIAMVDDIEHLPDIQQLIVPLTRAAD
jgi:hypothetical protein